MTPVEHEYFAQDLMRSLSDDSSESDILSFAPDPTKSRNAARAMTAILCHRLFKNSKQRPVCEAGTTYDWKNGAFNCRNIADRDYLWTNMRRGVATEMHETARIKPAAYLLACCKPADTTMNVWSIPEPILYDGLTSLPFEERGQKYTVQISTNKQRIDRYNASPDLTPYFRKFELAKDEFTVLEKSREVDAAVKRERASKRGEEVADEDDDEVAVESKIQESLATAAQALTDAGVFDPNGITDARERVVSSILRRRGQPAFRQHLLAAYNGRCAVTSCDVEAVLDAAHIVPYRGPETNHPANGLLLRTDIHTLFDLNLISVDVAKMTVLVSPELAGSIYDEYRGSRLKLPRNRESWPSREALCQHRRNSTL